MGPFSSLTVVGETLRTRLSSKIMRGIEYQRFLVFV